jgi:hypothetical protein
MGDLLNTDACTMPTAERPLRERVRDLVERETTCCSFFTFAIEGLSDAVVLDISVPQDRREILDALADRAEEPSA